MQSTARQPADSANQGILGILFLNEPFRKVSEGFIQKPAVLWQ